MKKAVFNRIFIVLIAGMALTLTAGCAAHQTKTGPKDVAPARLTLAPDIDYMIDANDPLEGLNRRIYIFNSYVDKYFFLPIVSGYAFVTPNYVEDRISSFFNNLREIKTFVNCLFQLKARAGGITFGRFITNTTIGLAGFYDPATSFGWVRHREDFGQTLGSYGIGPGPYLVLPIFGPSSLRDGAGLLFDSALKSAVIDAALDDTEEKSAIVATLNTLNAIDTRHRLSFRYYKSGSPFEYELVRRLYLDMRDIEIEK
jgi:phospholipid-binding lipoprotein MlaA